MKPTRTAFSLLELVISMSLFGVVMVAVLQSMVATTNYVDFDAARGDLTNASMQCQNRVISDLANTAWFYAWDKDADRPLLNATTKQRTVLFPVVSGANGTRLEFLKLRTSLTVDPVPSKEQYGYLSFRNENTPPVEFSQYVDAVPTPLMIMNPNYVADPQLFVAPVWESSGSNVSLTFDDNQNPVKLRHYLYVVENNAVGIPCLVRKYLNGYTGASPAASLWTFDATLAENVAEVQFATWREEPTLNENQIRIMVLLRQAPSSASTTGIKVDRRVEIIAAMRSINQDT